VSIDPSAIEEITHRPFPGRLAGYARLTGPGWMQAAVTLGGGSLASALYLGVIAGYSLMWLQPLAMLCGVIMLMALSHVTLDKGDYPFETVKRTISPLLAWGWLVATVIANVVFCTAQSALGVATVQQNLGLGGLNAYVITVTLSLIAFASALLYVRGSEAGRLLERILKLLVALVMVSFAAAAGVLVFSGQVDLLAVLRGFIPQPGALFRPAETLAPLVEATGPAQAFWSEYITGVQRDRIIAAFGAAVGINMTFLLPYTLLKRGWTRVHRQLSRYDLMMALFVPFSIATAMLVISAASAFHTQTGDVLDADGRPDPALAGGYYSILETRLAHEGALPADPLARRALADALPFEERQLAAAITNRDARQLANTLSPVLGERLAHGIFGLGVLAMALSTMMVHLVMNGFAISQAVGSPGSARPFLLGATMPALLAIFAPLAWSGDAKAALLIPAAVIATVFLPVAYLAILLLMNSRATLGAESRATPLVNVAMLAAAGVAIFASVWRLSHSGLPGTLGIIGLSILAVVGIGGFVKNQRHLS
jgi:Mn2+/Fe2+ NRAMP family transporter